MKRNFRATLDKKTQEITVTAKLKLLPPTGGILDAINTTEAIAFVEEVEKLPVIQIIKPDLIVNNREGFNEGVWIFKVVFPLPPEKKPKTKKEKKETIKKAVSVHEVIAALADKLDTVEETKALLPPSLPTASIIGIKTGSAE